MGFSHANIFFRVVEITGCVLILCKARLVVGWHSAESVLSVCHRNMFHQVADIGRRRSNFNLNFISKLVPILTFIICHQLNTI